MKHLVSSVNLALSIHQLSSKLSSLLPQIGSKVELNRVDTKTLIKSHSSLSDHTLHRSRHVSSSYNKSR